MPSFDHRLRALTSSRPVLDLAVSARARVASFNEVLARDLGLDVASNSGQSALAW